MEALAGLVAWLGAAIVVVSEGRRGFALGLALAGIGLAGVSLAAGHSPSAAALAAGGVLAAGLRLRDGDPGWGVMPPGSTPRVILSIVVLALAAFVSVSLVGGRMPWLELAALACAGLGGGRLFGAPRRAPALAAAALMALGIGATSDFAAAATGAAVAAALGAIPGSGPAPAGT
jgi:hypothetical protein